MINTKLMWKMFHMKMMFCIVPKRLSWGDRKICFPPPPLEFCEHATVHVYVVLSLFHGSKVLYIVIICLCWFSISDDWSWYSSC